MRGVASFHMGQGEVDSCAKSIKSEDVDCGGGHKKTRIAMQGV